jgi:signal recognition particle subunit SRP54
MEKRKKKVLTVSGDVYRPAAIEQLRTVTAQAGAEWFPSTADQKPVDIARAALDYARKHFFDVLLVDTAGRLAIDEALMREIKDLHAALNPVETLFVVDAMQGQDAVNTAKAFKEALPLTGIILTKTDGDSRGGAALSVRQITGAPIKFAGTSEKLDGLEVFDARAPCRPHPGHGRHPGAGRAGHAPASTCRRPRSWRPRSRAARASTSTTSSPRSSRCARWAACPA